MYNEEVQLVAQNMTINEYGDQVSAETVRTVYANVHSIGMREFYQANALGFKPEIKFALPDYLEYNGESIVRYKPYGGTQQEYSVIRVYKARTEGSTELELTCVRGVDK